ncbi:quinol monooxygenase YgiN [Thermocatellispora tengchongensis]|uniref:Quinol monooxygenase YgiN n=1 Tax=Thermocatellispora tengchongensis TaxID=1073253 RepID=A0A840PJV5_9ACTN|nr:putative quinol monooxygenase [Thermocatellispora tengchongensis]MBB5137860.1 quinol monooxygenase YgiN [Thermocatellispora tengchongensis]
MAFVVTALWTAKRGEEENVARILAELVGPSRDEPGSLFYQPHRDPEDPRRFFFYEQYTDRAAYEAHGSSEHFQKLGFGQAIPLLESRERWFYETWEPDGSQAG